jgi:dihydrofolate synthase/folylpolyglutamate synthase
VLDRLFALETIGIKLGLENITRLCAALGHPERQFATLLVAGTNGKGSVTAMTHAALVSGKIRAARYTSPHLVDLRERFVIGEEPVAQDALEETASAVLDCADRLHADGQLAAPPTFFEATTAIAFELFRRHQVEAAVIEVGLGGRFDATNVVSPVATAITSIGLDHQEYLGTSIAAIAGEKAGIIKAGVPVVIGALRDEARAVITSTAAERGAPVIDASRTPHDAHVLDGRATLIADTAEDRYGPLTLSLRGEHQVGNALVAIRLLEAARAGGVWLPGAAIERGLTAAEWPARLELIALPGGRRVLLDAAHNVDGAASLAAYIARWHPERPALVLGVMRDKDVDGIIDALLPVVSAVICTHVATPRALPGADLAQRVRGRTASAAAPGGTDVEVEDDPSRALDRALARTPTVCVGGSIFLAGAVRDALTRRAILPSFPAT